MSTTLEATMVKFVLDQLQGLLHGQIQTLIKLGYHTALKMTEEKFTNYIMETAGREIPEFMEVEEHQLPILLVIPENILPLKKQMELLGIQSDHCNPIWTIAEIITSPKPYLVFEVEYIELENVFPENISYYLKPEHKQALTFVQGLGILTQCEELLCQSSSLIFAGSCWYVKGVKYVPEFSCHGNDRRIMGRVARSGHCGSLFALCRKN